MSISADQCRAARALINWTRDDLAGSARVSRRTIIDFERGARNPQNSTLTVLRSAFENAGIIFIEEDEQGPGVRLRKGLRPSDAPPFPVIRPELPFGIGRFGVWRKSILPGVDRRVALIQMTPTPQVDQTYDSVVGFWANTLAQPDTLRNIITKVMETTKGIRRPRLPEEILWYFWQPDEVFPRAFPVFAELVIKRDEDGFHLSEFRTMLPSGAKAFIQSPELMLDWSRFDEPTDKVD